MPSPKTMATMSIETPKSFMDLPNPALAGILPKAICKIADTMSVPKPDLVEQKPYVNLECHRCR